MTTTLHQFDYQTLEKKRRDAFAGLLDEAKEVGLTSSWKEAKRALKGNPRLAAIGDLDRRLEKEFKVDFCFRFFD